MGSNKVVQIFYYIMMLRIVLDYSDNDMYII